MKTIKKVSLSLVAFACSIWFLGCPTPPAGETKAIVKTITCGTLTPANFTQGVAYTGTISVSYTEGNGGDYSGFSFALNGLTFSTIDGKVATGSGVVTINISGTPIAVGTFSQEIKVGGQSCNFSITIIAPTTVTPTSATISYPASNASCVSNSNSVNFQWVAGQNTMSYGLFVRNLLTKQIVYSTSGISGTSLVVTVGGISTISLATPYRWWLVSATTTSPNIAYSNDTTNSRFYLAGTAASSNAPFPAELTGPANNALISSGNTFNWIGSSTDNNIVSYDFWVSVNNSESKVSTINTSSTTGTYQYTFTYPSGTQVKWWVVTNDRNKNSATSSIRTFTVQ